MTSPSDTSALDTSALTAADIGATTDSAAHAAALQSVLTDLSTMTLHQLVVLFRQYQNARNFPEILKAAFPHIVSPHAHAAATVTAKWYNDIAPNRNPAVPVVQLPLQRMDKTIAWALYAPTPAESDQAIVAPRDVTLSRLAGSTKRMVFDASRDTVVSNVFQQGIRWARVAQPDACAFCRVMASKTDSSRLYRTEASATRVVGRSVDLTAGDRQKRASGLSTNDELLARRYKYSRGDRAGQDKVGVQRGSQAIGEKYHDHCRCTAVPIPDGQSYQAPEYTAQWSQDYKDAVKATEEAGQTKGKYGAIDFNAVLAHMREHTEAR